MNHAHMPKSDSHRILKMFSSVLSGCKAPAAAAALGPPEDAGAVPAPVRI